jgi:hypothetical protein
VAGIAFAKSMGFGCLAARDAVRSAREFAFESSQTGEFVSPVVREPGACEDGAESSAPVLMAWSRIVSSITGGLCRPVHSCNQGHRLVRSSECFAAIACDICGIEESFARCGLRRPDGYDLCRRCYSGIRSDPEERDVVSDAGSSPTSDFD